MEVRCHLCGRKMEFSTWAEFLMHMLPEAGFVYDESKRCWIKNNGTEKEREE
jgi:hypothetical protein